MMTLGRPTYDHIHKLIYENEVSTENPSLFEFSLYNGPNHSDHTNKRLMEITELDSHNQSSKQLPRNSKCFIDTLCMLFKDLADKLGKDEFLYKLYGRLGITYFHGKSTDWTQKLSFGDLQNFVSGMKRPLGFSTDSYLSSCFNANKSIEHVEKFRRMLNSRGYKLCAQTKSFDLKLCKSNSKDVINISFNENFEILSVSDELYRIWNIDLIRDRNKSRFKLTGTFLDIYDLRVQLVKFKQKPNLLNKLGIELNDNEKLLQKNISSENMEYLDLNQIVNLKVQYLREVNSEKYELPNVKGYYHQPEFARNFMLDISTIAEYQKCTIGNISKTYRKKFISNSVVSCVLNFENCLKSFRSNEFDESIYTFADVLQKEMIYLSDSAFECAQPEAKRTKTTWFKTVFGLVDYVESSDKSTTSYISNGRMMSFEVISLIKRINYSKDYLEIFGLHAESENLNQIPDTELCNKFSKMVKLITDEEIESMHLNSNELQLILSKVDGMSKFAVKRLINAFETLHNPNKRIPYLQRNKK